MAWFSICAQIVSFIPIPMVQTAAAIAQAIFHATYGNYISCVICLMGAVPIPYANKVTKILGDYVGVLIKTGVAPTVVIQFIAKILGNLTRCTKAFTAICTLISLVVKYKQGNITWNDL